MVRQRLGHDLPGLPAYLHKPQGKVRFSKSPFALYLLPDKRKKSLGKQDSKFSFGKKSSSVLPEIDDGGGSFFNQDTATTTSGRLKRLNVDTDIEFEELNLEHPLSNGAPPNYMSP